MFKFILYAQLCAIVCTPKIIWATESSSLVQKEIKYKMGKTEMTGYLAYDENRTAQSTVPGVLVVHDWMGLTDKTKKKADDLAELGYVAFAADIYGTGIRPTNQKEASGLAGQYKSDRKTYREHLNAALDVLKKQKQVNDQKLAAIGFCFGGTGVIELARSGANVKGVVSFHGGLDSPTPKDGRKIKTRVLALHGADDPYVKPEDLTAFESEMRDNKVDWRLIKYGNAVHSFTDKSAGTDNSKGAAYNEAADKRSWVDMRNFFAEIL